MSKKFNKFTFKKSIFTGTHSAFTLKHTDIKLNKKIVGDIQESRNAKPEGKYSISLMVKKSKTEKDPAPFRWLRLKKRFPTEELAREYLGAISEIIQSSYEFYSREN